ncbi:MAG: hypothetical protein QOF25_849 [Mycobacterium sp.]|nr:hypothetical protein [Mycobacterium sp.]
MKEVSEMTTDTLAEAVLDEAEAIVCAEWMRLQHDTASREDALTGPHAEMPAARRRPQRVATLTATLRRPAITHPARRGGWPARRWPGLPVWATQRSPPRHSGVTERVVEQWRWCHQR